ncbi:MAG: malto-oligosyltrehalose trehalohydrolase [Pirellulaceae bacterium]|nr:malto-oligosyltrehalose trehalohydrolase [Pirellulaceae bacterium]
MLPPAPSSPPQGAWLDDAGTCRWRVWAPRARQVELVLIDNAGQRRRWAMLAEPRGYFSAVLPNIPEGQRYAYRLDGGPERPDPASRWQPDGVHAASAVWNPRPFAWTDRAWRGVRRRDLVIYELHVGTFTPEGTLDAILPRLAELRELGVTALELMPVAQFPGTRDWGYDGVFWFAVQNSYGGPRALQRLVNAAHEAGLAVLLDVVHNHLGPEGNYLPEFGPCFSQRFRTPWGDGINYDERGSDEVRALVLANARSWLRDFHLDGLRLDAIHAVHDQSPTHILAAMRGIADDEAALRGWPAYLIGESDLNDARVLRAVDAGGYGLDAQWSDDFHHCVHALLTGEQAGYYADFFDPARQLAKALRQAFVHDGTYSIFRGRHHGAPPRDLAGDRFVVSIQTHDHVGNRARGERLHQLLSPPQQRLASGLLLLAPSLPLMFMGEEYGETRPFPFFCDFADPALQSAVRAGRQREFADFHWQGLLPDPLAAETFAAARLSWDWSGDPARAGLRRLYVDLLAARRTWPTLADYEHRHARLVETSGGSLLVLERGAADRPREQLEAYFNLTADSLPLPTEALRRTVLLRSSDPRYGEPADGPRSPNLLAPWEFVVCAGTAGASP